MNIKLILAGQIQQIHQDFFQKEIKPLLNKNIQYAGEIPNKELSSFMAKPRLSFFPWNGKNLSAFAPLKLWPAERRLLLLIGEQCQKRLKMEKAALFFLF